MKKRMTIAVVAMFLAILPCRGQVFILDGENDPRKGANEEEFNLIVPQQNVDWDQYGYAPMGSGVALLIGLGAAYGLSKRRKEA